MNDDIFDQHANSYSSTIDQSLAAYGASHDFFTRHKARLINWLLSREGCTARQMDLLDVGCGIGNIHELIGPEFRSVAGVDVSAASIEEARRRFPDYEYLAYDGHRLPYADASKDISLAICVFHHVPPTEWAALAAEMLRVLRPGGFALVIEHNPWNPVTRRIVNRCPIDRDAVLLSRPRTIDLFRKAGATQVQARSILSVPPKTEFLMRIDNMFGALPLGAQYWCLARKARA
ncbi:MAG: methyltransferase domain-containing protein [Rhodobacteraceae bacterium]|nr:methyltransferase domain-containing protein [Paracoccaceae bacterium]